LQGDGHHWRDYAVIGGCDHLLPAEALRAGYFFAIRLHVLDPAQSRTFEVMACQQDPEVEVMHISDFTLQGMVCPITAVLSLLGVAATAIAVLRSESKPDIARFSVVTVLIFAVQMLDFPITSGTSGCLLGGVLAALLLGTPSAVLSMTLVLMVQSLAFGDGGLLALGANVLNMALIGVGVGSLPCILARRRHDLSTLHQATAAAAAGFISVMLVALAVSVELAATGSVPFVAVAGAMLDAHAWIGIGEGLLTAILFLAVAPRPGESFGRPLAVACAALLASPWASDLPNGLERAAGQVGLLSESVSLLAPLADYRLPGIANPVLTTVLASIYGALLTFSLAWLLGSRLLRRPASGTC
jgi:cobalt/nickel transport system permease protein